MARHTAFRFTLVANSAISAACARHAGAARFAYNRDLRAVKDALDANRSDRAVKVPWTGFDMINHFNAWKRSTAAGRTWSVDSSGVAVLVDTGLAWRGEVCAQVFEEAGVDLGRALEAYSESRRGGRKGRRVGFPKFKKKGQCRESFRMRNRVAKEKKPTIRVGEGHNPRSITLPSLGTVMLVEDTRRLRRLLRPDSEGFPRARIWFVTISRRRGRWRITINVEADDFHRAMRHSERDPEDHCGFVGVDRGITAHTVAATADGTEVARHPAPMALARSLRKLRQASRRASRKQLGSQNRRKADEYLSRAHARIADQRRHFLHEVTTQLVKTHDRLCLEDLAVANMVRNRRLARLISDAAWGEFARQIGYKAVWYGTEVVVAPRFFPSSKICSGCGRLNDTLVLRNRTFHCDPSSGGCGLALDRDLNAAINLAAWAEAEHGSATRAPDLKASGRVTNACRGTSAGRRIRGGGTGPATPSGKKQERSRATQPAA